MGFRRVVSNDTTQYEVPVPAPTSEGFQKLLDAVHTEGDADSFLGVLAGILQRQGFEAEAIKVLHYPSIFCPCVTHVTRVGADFTKIAF